jgi:hypothetical protein
MFEARTGVRQSLFLVDFAPCVRYVDIAETRVVAPRITSARHGRERAVESAHVPVPEQPLSADGVEHRYEHSNVRNVSTAETPTGGGRGGIALAQVSVPGEQIL